MKKKYILVEKFPLEVALNINYEKIEGYHIKPQNKIKYDGILVDKLIIIKPSFIQKLIKKKIKRKLDNYLEFIIGIMDEKDDDAIDDINKVLDSFERYKLLIKGIYFKYLDEKYYNLLLKKIDVLNSELLKKKYIIENRRKLGPKEEIKGKSK